MLEFLVVFLPLKIPLAEILGSVRLVKKTISTIIMVFYLLSSRKNLNLMLLYVPICESWIINELLLICIQNHMHIAQKYIFVIGKWLNLFFVVQLSLVGISASESVHGTISQQQTNGSGCSTFSSLLSKVLTCMHTCIQGIQACVFCVYFCVVWWMMLMCTCVCACVRVCIRSCYSTAQVQHCTRTIMRG